MVDLFLKEWKIETSKFMIIRKVAGYKAVNQIFAKVDVGGVEKWELGFRIRDGPLQRTVGSPSGNT